MGDRETKHASRWEIEKPASQSRTGRACRPALRGRPDMHSKLSALGFFARTCPFDSWCALPLASNAIFLPNSVAGPFLFAKERMDEPLQLAGHGRARPELRSSSVSPNAAYKITNKSWGRLIKDCSEECRREALRTLAH